MKVLQVGYADLVGKRFNGYDLSCELNRQGIKSEFCTWKKEFTDPQVWQLFVSKYRLFLRGKVNELEDLLSIQSLLYPFWLQLPFDKRYMNSDVVHFQLINSGFFSLLAFPILTHLKPSVWTLHDPWAFTGHCVHPFDCDRWKTGCGKCPYLKTDFEMLYDRTAFMWKVKNITYRFSNLHLIVASRWMKERVEESPLLSRFPLHYIPFGIDTDAFIPGNKSKAKKNLGVFPNSLVISFRSNRSTFKKSSSVVEIIKRLKTKKKLCLLSFDERGTMDQFRGKHQIIDLGWLNDDQTLIEAYQGSDLFLSASTAESFGMMAIEAMSCGVPVVGYDGTALTNTIFSPNGGITLKQGDVKSFSRIVDSLLSNPLQRKKIGSASRKIALRHYSIERYVKEHLDLYKTLSSKDL